MITLNDFVKRSIEKHGDKYDYSQSHYMGCERKLTIICKKCNYTFEQEPRHHMNGIGCPKCSNKYKPTTEEFIIKSKQIHGDKYFYEKTLYKNNITPLIITCKIHGDFKQKPVNHLNRKHGCPVCIGNYKSNTFEFIEKSKKIFGDRFNYEHVNYVNWYTKVDIICKKHSYKFKVQPNAHLSKKQGCPKCNMSRSEFNIYKILENNKINFEYQKTFELCKNKNKLPFDFFLIEKNTCIEFDGEQHLKPIKKFGGIENFNKVIKNDEIKNKFCENNNLKLIRISYTNNTYEKLEKILKSNNII